MLLAWAKGAFGEGAAFSDLSRSALGCHDHVISGRANSSRKL